MAPSGSASPDAPAKLLVDFDAGQVVFCEGDAGREMYVIQEGQVELVRGQGARERRLALLDAGDFFGEMSVLEDAPRGTTARATAPSKLLVVDASTFDRMLRLNPDLAMRMLRTLSHRLLRIELAQEEALRAAQAVLDAPISHSQAVPILAPLAAAAVPEPAREAAPPRPPVGSGLATKPAPAGPPPLVIAPTAASTSHPAMAPGAEAALGHPRLVHRLSGEVFALRGEGETTVGRRDPVSGLVPDVDLGAVDAHKSLSRRHARFVRDGEGYLLREEIGVANGTFVNGQRLETGVPRRLADGDELRFGLVALTLHLT